MTNRPARPPEQTGRLGVAGLLGACLIALATWPALDAGRADRSAARRGPILFVGSSIFHRWTNLATQMAPLPMVNRAVDGLQTTDMLRMLSSDVLPARPKVIVVLLRQQRHRCRRAGRGDRRSDSAIRRPRRPRRCRRRVSSSSPSIARRRSGSRWDVVDAVNHQIEADAARAKRLQYVDVNPVLFNRDGTPRIEFYVSDQLHFRPAAYDEFAKILKPVLTARFPRKVALCKLCPASGGVPAPIGRARHR